jgi:Xaa-Pro dipeptidase
MTNTFFNPIDKKTQALREAQLKAKLLFEKIEGVGLIKAGHSEQDITQAIVDLAHTELGIRKFWHKRIVRCGENTLLPYRHNPPNLTVQPDDIVFVDLGPVFEEWEADFGCTYVLGDDPLKHKIKQDGENAFALAKAHYATYPDITAQTFYYWITELAHKMGWSYGGPYAGHIVGEFPHEKRLGDEVSLYIHPDNPLALSAPDADGNFKQWILEIHFVDIPNKIGSFYEDLLI